MALEDIFAALEEQADKEIEEILADARDQAQDIAERAADEAESIKNAKIEQAEKVTRTQASQSVNAARLEGKKRVAAVKEESVNAVYDLAQDKLAHVRADGRYADIFRALAQEALKGMSGDLEVLVDPADVELARTTLFDLGVEAQIKPELTTSGGLVIAMQGGRIKRRNTFEDRVEKVRQTAHADVAEILFS